MIPVDTMEEYNEIDETNPETQDAFAAYLAEGSQKDREVCVSQPAVILMDQKLKTVHFRWFSVESLGLQLRRSRMGSPSRVFGPSYPLNPTRRLF